MTIYTNPAVQVFSPVDGSGNARGPVMGEVQAWGKEVETAIAAGTSGKRVQVRAATTANITIATALNNGDTLDGVALVTADLVLVKNQTAPAENGIYVVGVTPARDTGYDAYDDHYGMRADVVAGTVNAATMWSCSANKGGTLGTTAILFTNIAFEASGDVVGPASSVDGRVAVFDGTTGKAIEDGGVLLSALAPKDSPAFTNNPTAPTQSAANNSTRLATTEYVDRAAAAALASPAFTGNPTAPTQSAGNNSTRLATTEYADRADALIAAAISGAQLMKGGWDASAGTFPGAGVAQPGWYYVVTTGGTVNGVTFILGDSIYALVSNASTTTYAANWQRAGSSSAAADYVMAELYGVSPSASEAVNTAGMTAAIAAVAGTGKEIRVAAPGTIVTDSLLLSNSIRIKHAPGVIMQLKPNATPRTFGSISFRNVYTLTAGDSEITGGTIDANRAGQSLSDYNTGGGWNAYSWGGIFVHGTGVGSEISNIKINAEIINAMDWAIDNLYTKDLTLNLLIDGSGCGARVRQSIGLMLERAIMTNIDNTGAKIACHAFDLIGVQRVRGGNLSIRDMGTDDTVASGGALSDWFSAFSLVGVNDVVMQGIDYSARESGGLTKSVGLTSVGGDHIRLSGITGRRFGSAHMELGGNTDTEISDFLLDGGYQQTLALFPNERSLGITVHNNRYYADQLSRVLAPSKDVRIYNGVVRRMIGTGIVDYIDEDVRYGGIKSYGNQNGMELQSNNVQNSSFLTTEAKASARARVTDSDFNFNEVDGVKNMGGNEHQFVACSFDNNGQAKSSGKTYLRDGYTTVASITTASGYRGVDASVTTDRINTKLIACSSQDNQSTTTSKGSINPSALDQCPVWNMTLWHMGQTVKLKGCGPAAADLTTQILNITEDTLTLLDDVTTVPLVAGTGTIATSGKTITGVGTAFTTQILGQTWIKAGGNYRLVRVVTSATAATLDTAFPADLTAGTTFEVVTFVIEQIRSQTHGIITSNATRDAGLVAVNHDFGAGNVTANTSLATDAMISPIQWPALPMRLTLQDFHVINGSAAITAGTGGQTKFWAFDAAAVESIFAHLKVPRNAPPVRIKLTGANLGAGAGDFMMNLRLKTEVSGATTNASPSGVNFTTFTALAQDLFQIASLGTTTLAEGHLSFGVSRAATNVADTLANDWGLYAVDIEVA